MRAAAPVTLLLSALLLSACYSRFSASPDDTEITDEEFTEDAGAIELQVRAQIARVKWNQIEEARVLAEQDPQIQFALTLFDEAADLARRGAENEGTLIARLRESIAE